MTDIRIRFPSALLLQNVIKSLRPVNDPLLIRITLDGMTFQSMSPTRVSLMEIFLSGKDLESMNGIAPGREHEVKVSLKFVDLIVNMMHPKDELEWVFPADSNSNSADSNSNSYILVSHPESAINVSAAGHLLNIEPGEWIQVPEDEHATFTFSCSSQLFARNRDLVDASNYAESVSFSQVRKQVTVMDCQTDKLTLKLMFTAQSNSFFDVSTTYLFPGRDVELSLHEKKTCTETEKTFYNLTDINRIVDAIGCFRFKVTVDVQAEGMMRVRGYLTPSANSSLSFYVSPFIQIPVPELDETRSVDLA